MPLIQILVLALIQGLTEFLPVSSSAHLILGSKALGWPDQGLVFDVRRIWVRWWPYLSISGTS